MKIHELKNNLVEAYSPLYLNKISLVLIKLYKNKEILTLQKIAEIIDDYVSIHIDQNGKGFSKLIKLYHPDRSSYYINTINELTEQNNLKELIKHEHILRLRNIEEFADSITSSEDIDYNPVYEWDIEIDGFTVDEEIKYRKTYSKCLNYNFYDAIKIREYGHTDIEFPSYYLQDFEEFELISAGINNLDGIQYCLHAKSINLADNKIVDLSLLEGLIYLEEINLDDNFIFDIEPLGNIPNLKKVFLANNRIEDISILFDLPKIEYVNLSGNKIKAGQIQLLAEQGIHVDY